MTLQQKKPLPKWYSRIEADTRRIGFSMPSDKSFGPLLRALAASKPGGLLLELGTGTGLSASWLLDGMDQDASLITIDNDQLCSGIAKKHLGSDDRVSVLCTDASNWLATNREPKFDLIFADTWAGKYRDLEQALSLLQVGGIYIIDDMEEQPHWSPAHSKDARSLIHHLNNRSDLLITELKWASGIIIATKGSGT